MPYRSKSIEAVADKQRRLIKSGLPIDVEAIAAINGLTVTKQPMEQEVSGMLVVKGKGGAIGINEDHAASRQRFTLAHELGHFLLHSKDTQIFVDASPVFYRKEKQPSSVTSQEREANQFAAALLMPSDVVLQRVTAKSLDPFDEVAVKKLAGEFGVSVSAMTFRLMALGVME